ncbi:MAG: hypothetical protein CL823_06330 [Crocinitomicaceae bacterium]|nr:hypothetical protein [Crocinitomicaceae bacterium]|tara:strand:+ start:2388 stop:3014 length:627 start_codon:yes stop_codon:yes gene_type:complete
MKKIILALCAIATVNMGFVHDTAQAQTREAVKNYNLGVQASERGDHKLAATLYSIALGHDINFSHAFYNRGMANYYLGYKGKAIKDFTSTIRIDESYALAYNNRGMCYDDLEEFELALEDYEKSIELNPTDHRSYFNMGLTYMSLGKFRASIKCFDLSLQLEPFDADAYKNRGLLKELLNIDFCDDFKSACLFGLEECCEWESEKCNQ